MGTVVEHGGYLWRRVGDQNNIEDAMTRSATGAWYGYFVLFGAGVAVLWFLVSGRHQLVGYQERVHRLEMCRRHGIPDSDHRPFSIAYKTAATKREQEEREMRHQEELKTMLAKRRAEEQRHPVHDKENLRPSELFSSPRPRSDSTVHSYTGTPHVRFAGRAATERDAYARPSSQPLPDSLLNEEQYTSLFISAEPVTASQPIISNCSQPSSSAKRPHVSEGVQGEYPETSIKRAKKYDDTLGSKRHAGDDIDALATAPPDKKAKTSMDIDTDTSNLSSKDYQEMDMDTDLQLASSHLVENLKQRLDYRKPQTLSSRGKKRDRSDAGSLIAGLDGEIQHIRKRERIDRKPSNDSEIMQGVLEGDSDYSETEEGGDEPLISMDPLCQGRHIGEEWEINKQRFKVGVDGSRLRHALVRQHRKKFNMPKDSIHPDASQKIQVVVEAWLSEEEYRNAKEKRQLAWQDDPSTFHSKGSVPSPVTHPGKELLWSVPGSSTRRNSGTSVLGSPNPFNITSKIPPARASFGHSISSNSLQTGSPQLRHSRSYSKWEKQDIEAAALDKIRNVKEKKSVEQVTSDPKLVPSSASKVTTLSNSKVKSELETKPITSPSNPSTRNLPSNTLSDKPVGALSSVPTLPPMKDSHLKSVHKPILTTATPNPFASQSDKSQTSFGQVTQGQSPFEKNKPATSLSLDSNAPTTNTTRSLFQNVTAKTPEHIVGSSNTAPPEEASNQRNSLFSFDLSKSTEVGSISTTSASAIASFPSQVNGKDMTTSGPTSTKSPFTSNVPSGAASSSNGFTFRVSEGAPSFKSTPITAPGSIGTGDAVLDKASINPGGAGIFGRAIRNLPSAKMPSAMTTTPLFGIPPANSVDTQGTTNKPPIFNFAMTGESKK